MNKKTLLTYPAIFTQENGQYWVEFIDLEGIVFRRLKGISNLYS